MIKIDENFYIDADSNSYVLKEKYIIQDEKSKRQGEEAFKDKGYYVSLEGTLNGYLKTQTREWINNNDGDVKDLIKEVENQNKFIKSLKLKV